MENDAMANQGEPARRAALVTGGAVRVGRAITRALATTGFDIAIHYCRSEAEASGLAAEIVSLGGRAAALGADLTRPQAPTALVTRAVDEFGRLDLLVNSAAIFLPDSASMAEIARMKVLNVDAPRALIDAAADHLAATGGSVVNISDVAAMVPYRGHKAYGRTKAALLGMTGEKALDLAVRGVRVNAICPGVVLFADGYDEARRRRIIERIPLGRVGVPEDVAEAVVFLAGARYVTGQILTVDGGRALAVGNPPRRRGVP